MPKARQSSKYNRNRLIPLIGALAKEMRPQFWDVSIFFKELCKESLARYGERYHKGIIFSVCGYWSGKASTEHSIKATERELEILNKHKLPSSE